MGASEAYGAARRPSMADDSAMLVQLAIDEVLHSDPDFSGLPDVLERFALAWHSDAALALTLPEAGTPVMLAGWPHDATTHRALPAAIVTLVNAHPAAAATAHAGGAFQAPLAAGEWSDRPVDALIAYAGAAAGEQRCAVVLIGKTADWDAQTRSVARMIAVVVAAQLRHTGDRAYLQEEEMVTRKLIEASPYAVLVMDAQRRVVQFNPAAEELYGWRREDVLGKDLPGMLIPPRYRDRFIASVKSFLERHDLGELRGRIDMAVLRSDGSERLAELISVPLVVHGQTFFCGFLRDLSESERVHADRDASARRFELLAQRAPVGMAEAGPDGVCTFVNERWCTLNGGAPADYLGQPWLSVVHEDDVARLRRGWAHATARGAEFQEWCRLRRDHGRRVRVNVAPMPRQGDETPGFSIALTDVSGPAREAPPPGRGPAGGEREAPPSQAASERTEWLRVPQTGEWPGRTGLAAEAERLSSMFAMAVPGLVAGDERSRLTHVNESFRDMFGITEPPETLVGAPLSWLWRRIAGALAEGGKSLATLEELTVARRTTSGAQLACADGRFLECDYWPLYVAGEFLGCGLLFRDVTEARRRQRHLERQVRTLREAHQTAERERERLADLSERLRELSDLKTQFLTTVSQELRGPLTSIVSYTELVADEKGRLSADAAGFLSVIERNARQMTRLVQDLLLLSRIDSGVVPLELAPVPVAEVVDEAVQAARSAAERRGIMIRASTGEGPLVPADRARLRQVIDNLIANSITFSMAGSSVVVTALCEDRHWRIDVADSGIGIPESEVEHIFDRFFRASNCRKAGHPGSGLGLAVVKALTELHGGRVEVTSTLDRGSTFSVYLPIPAKGA